MNDSWISYYSLVDELEIAEDKLRDFLYGSINDVEVSNTFNGIYIFKNNHEAGEIVFNSEMLNLSFIKKDAYSGEASHFDKCIKRMLEDASIYHTKKMFDFNIGIDADSDSYYSEILIKLDSVG